MISFDKRDVRTWSRLGAIGAFNSIGLMEAKANDDRVTVLVADTYRAYGLERFAKQHEADFINVGIAEQNMIGIAAGYASEGYVPFACTYASFAMSRAYEFVRHNLGIGKHNVKIIGCIAGFQMGASGHSHWGVDDVALARAIPNMVVISPADAMEAVKVALAVAQTPSPTYVRLCGGVNTPIVYSEDYDFQIGRAVVLREGLDVAIVATGLLVRDALDAAEDLEAEGISCGVYNFHTIKPLDEDTLASIYAHYGAIVTVEEHSIIGGLGSAVSEHRATYSDGPRVVRLGMDDCYRQTGSRPFVLDQYGLTKEGIANTVRMAMRNRD
ncbi:MAG: transketolase family protein [Atopobiaceae bacterium]|nr:transketolase family protein [Atopobiaceae bacterium]